MMRDVERRATQSTINILRSMEARLRLTDDLLHSQRQELDQLDERIKKEKGEKYV